MKGTRSRDNVLELNAVYLETVAEDKATDQSLEIEQIGFYATMVSAVMIGLGNTRLGRRRLGRHLR